VHSKITTPGDTITSLSCFISYFFFSSSHNWFSFFLASSSLVGCFSAGVFFFFFEQKEKAGSDRTWVDSGTRIIYNIKIPREILIGVSIELRTSNKINIKALDILLITNNKFCSGSFLIRIPYLSKLAREQYYFYLLKPRISKKILSGFAKLPNRSRYNLFFSVVCVIIFSIKNI
jgi:hypothetical protein